uniref:NADH dehydrogenase [ubiquinone] 1 alpha subcomplex subunit 11 n=1 Tax=Rhipicephalus pulchellus TaxID=72859 RepID=L7LZI6_RHIPC
MVFIPPYESKYLFIYELWDQKRKELGWKPFSYYRTPADQEGLEKMLYLSLYSLKFGAVAGVFDGLAVSHATTLKHYLGRIGYWTVPGLVSTGAFVATNHCLAKVTGKDTVYNHMASAVVAASVWGAKFNSYLVGFPLAVGLAVMCGVKKLSVDAGMTTLAGDSPKHPEYWYFAQKNDFSIMKE